MHRLFLSAVLLAPATALAVPLAFTHQGRLLDASGVPLEGPHTLTFSLYDAGTDDTLWTAALPVELTQGYFSVALGPVELDDLSPAEVALGLSVDGADELGDRIPLRSVPYAVVAHAVKGGPIDATEVRVNGTVVIDTDGKVAVSWDDLDGVPAALDAGLADLSCAGGELARFDGAAWGCAAPDDHVHDAADIVSGVLSADQLPVGTGPDDVAAGDHGHSPADVGALSVNGGALFGDLSLEGNALTDFLADPADDEPYACDDGHAGGIWFDSANEAFMGCTGKEWVLLGGTLYGASQDRPGKSCKDILAVRNTATSGVHWIDPKSSGDAFEVWCEMEADGGGWTLVAYNYDKARTFLTGSYHAIPGRMVPTKGAEAALDPTAVGLTYTQIGFSMTDPQWKHTSRDYTGFWVGKDSRSTYNLKSNACQILARTDTAQWNGELLYFGGDGANDNGCTGGGSFFTTTGHTCDDGGGGVTTNNVWPRDASDPLWGYNCITSYSPTGAYKQGPIGNQGLHAYYVR